MCLHNDTVESLNCLHTILYLYQSLNTAILIAELKQRGTWCNHLQRLLCGTSANSYVPHLPLAVPANIEHQGESSPSVLPSSWWGWRGGTGLAEWFPLAPREASQESWLKWRSSVSPSRGGSSGAYMKQTRMRLITSKPQTPTNPHIHIPLSPFFSLCNVRINKNVMLNGNQYLHNS